MLKQIISSDAPAAIGPYSQAVVWNGMLFTSGQIPLDSATGAVVGDNIESQTKQVMKNLQAVVREAGTDFDHVIKTTCFLTDMADFAVFNQIYSTYFCAKPARSCVAVKSLPKGVLCEVELVAAIDKE